MTDLKACFESIGCADVSTFIQSGNVVFRSTEKDAVKLLRKIERALSARFAYASRAVVLTQAQLAQVIRGAPAGFGKQPDKYRYDVMFLKKPATATQALKSISPKEGVDTVHPGK